MVREGQKGTGAYVGKELDLFEQAEGWKIYLARLLRPFLHGRVLEAGAGKGATTAFLVNPEVTSWCCLEPDPSLCREIGEKIRAGALPSSCTSLCGTIGALRADSIFEAVAYIDVLEHIENDGEEVGRAARHLAAGGHLIVVAPAHKWLYAPFDRAIGHHRRYDRETLRSLKPEGFEEVLSRYIDSAGLLAVAGNRFIKRSSMPSLREILFWDRKLVPLSRRLDPVFRYHLGKSLLAVWKKASGPRDNRPTP